MNFYEFNSVKPPTESSGYPKNTAKIDQNNVKSWTSLISRTAVMDSNDRALAYFSQMRRAGIEPNVKSCIYQESSSEEVLLMMRALNSTNVAKEIHRSQFLENFLFGTSTSSYQGQLMKMEKGLNNWDVFSHIPGGIIDGHNGDVAADWQKKYDNRRKFLVLLM
ncbi:hypothetical protein Syun_016871 [Stephania yunnanensis]|uniref:Pentatricopeptide repeat-containing protein n=1 Tax=Stephania yunnanensis TaxID=152371 RepID=A0AAP0J607_9MAGN